MEYRCRAYSFHSLGCVCVCVCAKSEKLVKFSFLFWIIIRVVCVFGILQSSAERTDHYLPPRIIAPVECCSAAD